MISSGSPEMEDWNYISIESIKIQQNQDSMWLEKFKAVNSKVIRPSLENEIELLGENQKKELSTTINEKTEEGKLKEEPKQDILQLQLSNIFPAHQEI